MVITILDGVVAKDKGGKFEQVYKESVKHLDKGIVETFLLHDIQNPDAWKIVTVWESKEALDVMRQSGETPRGVQMFREVGAEPKLSLFEVKGSGK